MGLHGAIELAVRIRAPAHERANGAIGRQRDDGRLPGIERAAPLGQRALDDLAGAALEGGVERRLDHDLVAVSVFEARRRIAHEVHGVGHLGLVRHAHQRREADLFGARRCGLRPAQEACFVHLLDHEAAAGKRLHGTCARGVSRRRLEESGDDRGLGDGKVARGLGEIALRGGLDAVRPAAEIDAVEVELEDVALGQAKLEPERQHQLLGLARPGAIRGQEQVLGELLGEGRAALREAAGAQIGHRGAQHAERVDARMGEEAPVLDGDHGVGRVRGEHVERNIGARDAAFREQAIVTRQDAHHRPRRLEAHRKRIGEHDRVVDEERSNRGGGRQDEHQRPEQEHLPEAEPPRRAAVIHRRRAPPVRIRSPIGIPGAIRPVRSPMIVAVVAHCAFGPHAKRGSLRAGRLKAR